MIIDLGVIIAAGGGAAALAGWLVNRLTTALDKVVDRLDRIAENTAAHGARLDALERFR